MRHPCTCAAALLSGLLLSTKVIANDPGPPDPAVEIAIADSEAWKNDIIATIENLLSIGVPPRRVTGTANADAAALQLEAAFNEAGIDNTRQFDSVELMAWSTGKGAGSHDGQNVVAELTAANPVGIYIVCAHDDTQPTTPGADDNASGSAAVLAIANGMLDAIDAGLALNNTVRFVIFDGEEQGELGSNAYATMVSETGDPIIAVINLDMIGHYTNTPEADPNADPNFHRLRVFENVPSKWITDFAQAMLGLYPDLAITEIIRLVASGPGADNHFASDHQAFWNNCDDAIFFHESLYNETYHSEFDTLENMQPEYTAEVARFVMATLAHLQRETADGGLGSETCPDGGVMEVEPCGERTNDMCDTTPEALSCGDTLCGALTTDGDDNVDIDWFNLDPIPASEDLDGDGLVRVCIQFAAEMPVRAEICQACEPVGESASADVWETGTAYADIPVESNDHCFSITIDDEASYSCGGEQTAYQLTVTCLDPAVAACEPASIAPLTCPPGAFTENEPCGEHTNDTCDFTDQSVGCSGTICGRLATEGGPDVDWYFLDPLADPDGDGMVRICASFSGRTPTRLALCDDGCTELAASTADANEVGVVTAVVPVGSGESYCFSIALEGDGDHPCAPTQNEYQIVFDCTQPGVDAWPACPGVVPAPVNDDCADAILIFDQANDGMESIPFSNAAATTDGPELPPNCDEGHGTGLGKDIWYRWHVSQDALLTVSTCNTTAIDTRLAAYPDMCPPDTTPIACNDDDEMCVSFSSWMEFEVSAGEVVLIRLGGFEQNDPLFEAAEGAGTLTIIETALSDPCPADLDDDGVVGASDLAILLSAWGDNPGHPADLDDDGVIGASDLAMLLSQWGAC